MLFAHIILTDLMGSIIIQPHLGAAKRNSSSIALQHVNAAAAKLAGA